MHIYRFFALRTIDVDILQEREQKTLVKRKDRKGKGAVYENTALNAMSSRDEWSFVSADAIDDDLVAGWGSGYNFKSYPEDEDD